MTEHPIVVCYRGYDSGDAVQLGTLLAGALDEPLVLASAYRYEPVALSARVVPGPGNGRRAADAQVALRHARAFTRTGVEVREQTVPSAGTADALVALARDAGACMLVLGRDTHGHVTRSLLPRAPCPVAVAPLGMALPRTGPCKRIGIAYDGSPTAQWALIAAARLAIVTEARLLLLTAGPTEEHATTWLHVARLTLCDDIDSFETRALVGAAAETLVDASHDLDLLVCGSRGRGRPLAAILGSVSAQLVAHAQCPVVVVPLGVERSDGDPLGITCAAAAG